MNLRRRSPASDHAPGTVLLQYSVVDCWLMLVKAWRQLFAMMLGRRLTAWRLSCHLKRRPAPLRIALGSGPLLEEDWIGFDLIRAPDVFPVDLRRPLPLPSSSVDALLAEHVCEHLPLDDVIRLLEECHRVLKPGGACRIVSPDALLVADLLLGCESERTMAQVDLDVFLHGWRPDELLTLKIVNRLSHQFGDHHSLLTAQGVMDMMRRAGFVHVCSVPVTRTRHFPTVPAVHIRKYPLSVHEAFAVEAVKLDSRIRHLPRRPV